MALFNWRFGRDNKATPKPVNEFELYCNGRSAMAIRQALKEYKTLRERVRRQDKYDLKYLGRICSEVAVECTFVSKGAQTWRYRNTKSTINSAYPMAHWENYDLGRWEGSNWFYRTHLLNHVIKCLEEYAEKFNVRLG